jgi:hypothetical protein
MHREALGVGRWVECTCLCMEEVVVCFGREALFSFSWARLSCGCTLSSPDHITRMERDGWNGMEWTAWIWRGGLRHDMT